MKRKEIDHYMRSTGANIFSRVNKLWLLKHSVWKSQKKVTFWIASVASYVYILSGQGLIKNAKKNWRVFKNWSSLRSQCWMRPFGDFKTLCSMLQVSHWKKPKNVLAGSIYLVSRNMHISSFFTHCWHSMNHFLLYYSRSLSLNPLRAEQQEQGEKTDSRSLNYSVWTGKRLLPSGPKVCSLVNHYVAPPAVTPLSLFVSMENWKKN